MGGSFFVQGSARPLKALEPIDDTIERIAGFVFVVMIATGVITVAMGPVSAVGFGMIALAAVLTLFQRRYPGLITPTARRFISYGAFLALALPLSFVVAALVADALTAEVWATHSAQIAKITAGLEAAPGSDDAGIWAVLRDADRYREVAARIWSQADSLIGSYVSILAVYVFKVFLLPGLILGAFLILARWAAAGR